jgi:type I restriction enzyme R subunit
VQPAIRVLTDRRNVIVIADEAHRSQYGFRAKVAKDTGDISYGFAKYLRDGLPNAHSSASPGRSAVRCARQFR